MAVAVVAKTKRKLKQKDKASRKTYGGEDTPRERWANCGHSEWNDWV